MGVLHLKAQAFEEVSREKARDTTGVPQQTDDVRNGVRPNELPHARTRPTTTSARYALNCMQKAKSRNTVHGDYADDRHLRVSISNNTICPALHLV